jgi:photosystem II stability/assembly factor-like uncharacterized protein
MVEPFRSKHQKVLSFFIGRTGWTIGEDLLLIKKIHEIGKKWARIGTMLNGRSEHSVKNRYNHLLN